MSKGHVDAAAGGAFLSLTIAQATALIEKMVTNQSWGEGRKPQKGSQSAKEMELLAVKIDLLLEKVDGTIINTHRVKSVVTMATQGTISLRPKKKLHSSTTGIGHLSKVTVGGTISTAHKVITSQTLFQINLP